MQSNLGLALMAAMVVPAVSAPARGQQSASGVQTTSDANSSSLKGAAKAPLRDLNVVRTEIPQALLEAMNDPYARPKSRQCEELYDLVVRPNEALGDDIDGPPAVENVSMINRGRPVALGAMAGVASDAIPFRGIVRRLSGAAKHDEYVQSAITAGQVRRAYLKGLGEARACKSPATPSHALAGPILPPPVESEGIKARYPVR